MMGQLLSIMLFGEGFLTGITLTAMLGPVTMTILRYGMQVNKFAGVWAALGTWVSDFIFIAATFWMTASISEWAAQPEVKKWIYIIGGIALTLMGTWMMMTKRNTITDVNNVAKGSYTQAFAAGFLVNSMSPFTLFFWLGAALVLHMQSENPAWYYAGLMLSLAMGDFAKAWLAPKLTYWIREKYVYWVQVVAGIVIAITGLYVIGIGLFDW